MTKARGKVAFIIAETSAELPSMCKMLKFGGKSVSASRRLPPSARVAGSWGLTSLVEPICAFWPACGARSTADEQPDSASVVARNSAANRLPARALSTRLTTSARIRLRHRVQQPASVFVLRVGEDLPAVALLHDGAGMHHDDVVREMFDH